MNFSTNQELNSILSNIVESVKSFSEHQLFKLKELNQIAVSLSTHSDLDSILELIISKIMILTLCDGATIYLKDSKKLKFLNLKNNSLDNRQFEKLKRKHNSLPLYSEAGNENLSLVAVYCALKAEILNIDDVYYTDKFDFKGTKEFDKLMNYRSKSMLVIPMQNTKREVIGVLQLINKMSNSDIVSFSKDDEEFASSLASLAAVAIERVRYEELLFSSSKMATMGEMMDLIAHQWKQPLSIISATVSNLPISQELGLVDDELINTTTHKVLNQISHLTQTLNEFRAFFRPNKHKYSFKIRNAVESIVNLIADDLNKNSISININVDENIEAYGFESEFKHVLLNLINNSKDAFNEKAIKPSNRLILIETYYELSRVVVEFLDNAGGIPKTVIPHIFEPNFTTKDEERGTGMGLYMSKMIMDNMDGEITASNIDGFGAKFVIKLSRLN